GRGEVGLTFADGPGPSTPAILDLLAEYGVPATFFQCGVNARRLPNVAQAVAAAGHELGNHSHTHPLCAMRNRSFVMGEFARAQDSIAAATAQVPRLVRAPFGVRWFGFREMQSHLGLLGVMWSVLGLDWKLPGIAVAHRV